MYVKYNYRESMYFLRNIRFLKGIFKERIAGGKRVKTDFIQSVPRYGYRRVHFAYARWLSKDLENKPSQEQPSW